MVPLSERPSLSGAQIRFPAESRSLTPNRMHFAVAKTVHLPVAVPAMSALLSTPMVSRGFLMLEVS